MPRKPNTEMTTYMALHGCSRITAYRALRGDTGNEEVSIVSFVDDTIENDTIERNVSLDDKPIVSRAGYKTGDKGQIASQRSHPSIWPGSTLIYRGDINREYREGKEASSAEADIQKRYGRVVNVDGELHNGYKIWRREWPRGNRE